MSRLCLILLLTLIPTLAHAQVPIAVNDNSGGSLAKQLVHQIEREIDNHKDLELAGDEERYFMTLEVEAKATQSDEAAIYSVAWTVPTDSTQETGYFYDSTVGYCTRNQVKGEASKIVSRTYESAFELGKALREEVDSKM